VFRSLQMKLMLIMVLLIISLMTVVGAFLMNSAVRFFIDDFYTQVNEVTSRAEFTADDWEEVRRFERKLKEDGLRLVAPIDGTRDEFNPCPAFGLASAT